GFFYYATDSIENEGMHKGGMGKAPPGKIPLMQTGGTRPRHRVDARVRPGIYACPGIGPRARNSDHAEKSCVQMESFVGKIAESRVKRLSEFVQSINQ